MPYSDEIMTDCFLAQLAEYKKHHGHSWVQWTCPNFNHTILSSCNKHGSVSSKKEIVDWVESTWICWLSSKWMDLSYSQMSLERQKRTMVHLKPNLGFILRWLLWLKSKAICLSPLTLITFGGKDLRLKLRLRVLSRQSFFKHSAKRLGMMLCASSDGVEIIDSGSKW